MNTGGTAGTSTADHGSSLADDLSAFLGNSLGSGESPEPDAADAGAPPADGDAPALETSSAASEGANAAERAGEPPADAASETPDQGTPAVDDDPLAGSEPATYTVNGQTRTFDGLTKLGDKGAIVSAEAYPKLIQRLSERDNLYERQQSAYQRTVALENQLNELTKWTVKGQNGQADRVLTGAEAVEEQRVIMARTLESLRVFSSALTDPDTFASLVTVVPDQAGNPQIAIDQTALRYLQTAAENAAIKGESRVRAAMAQLRSALTAAPSRSDAPASSGTVDAAVASQTVDHFASDMGVTNLTDADKKSLAASLPRYVRPATNEERAQLGPDVRTVVDGSFRELVEHFSKLRTEAAASAKSSATAARENERRLAAAAVGGKKQPAKKPASSASRQSDSSRSSDGSKAWDLHMNLIGGRVGTAAE